MVEAEATREQFDVLRGYLASRHPGGGMADMTWPDYVAMVEDTAVRTHMVEYRVRSSDGGPGQLAACALVDLLADGLSLVYSFFDQEFARNSPGSFVIFDHVSGGSASAPALPLSRLLGARQREDGLQGEVLAARDSAAGRLASDVGPGSA